MSQPKEPAKLTGNRLLDALPHAEREQLLAQMERVSMEHGRMIIAPGAEIREVYFPINCMISLVSVLEDGTAIEAGVIGCEGMAGVPVLLGTTTTMESMIQIPGEALRARADVVRAEFLRGGPLQAILFRYVQALFLEISQTAACNNQHKIERRLSRWLLICSDSVRSNELLLTQEFIATMLGVRRAGVTEAALALQERGLITYHRGRINILDRAGLEQQSCECYRLVKDELERLLGRAP